MLEQKELPDYKIKLIKSVKRSFSQHYRVDDSKAFEETLNSAEIDDIKRLREFESNTGSVFRYSRSSFIENLQKVNTFINKNQNVADNYMSMLYVTPLLDYKTYSTFFSFKGSRAAELYAHLSSSLEKEQEDPVTSSDFMILSKLLTDKRVIKRVNSKRMSSFTVIFNSTPSDMTIHDLLKEYYGKDIYQKFENLKISNGMKFMSLTREWVVLKYISENGLDDTPIEWIESMYDEGLSLYEEL